VGARAEAVAGFICDSISDEDLEQLDEMADDPGLITGLISAEPMLSEHQGWLIAMVKDLQGRVGERFDDIEEKSTPTPTSADAPAPIEAQAAPAPEPSVAAPVEEVPA
jgi:hypothetical protein